MAGLFDALYGEATKAVSPAAPAQAGPLPTSLQELVRLPEWTQGSVDARKALYRRWTTEVADPALKAQAALDKKAKTDLTSQARASLREFQAREFRPVEGGVLNNDLLDLAAQGLAGAVGATAQAIGTATGSKGLFDFGKSAQADAREIDKLLSDRTIENRTVAQERTVASRRDQLLADTRNPLNARLLALGQRWGGVGKIPTSSPELRALTDEYDRTGGTSLLPELGTAVRNFAAEPLNRTAQAAGSSAPAIVAGAVGGLPGAAVAGGLLGAGQGADAFDRVMALDDAAIMANPELATRVRALGGTPQAIAAVRQQAAERASNIAAGINAPIGAAGALLGARFGAESAVTRGAAAQPFLRSAGVESGQEGVEGALNQATTNYAVQTADPTQALSAGVAPAAVEEALAGMGMTAGLRPFMRPAPEPVPPAPGQPTTSLTQEQLAAAAAAVAEREQRATEVAAAAGQPSADGAVDNALRVPLPESAQVPLLPAPAPVPPPPLVVDAQGRVFMTPAQQAAIEAQDFARRYAPQPGTPAPVPLLPAPTPTPLVVDSQGRVFTDPAQQPVVEAQDFARRYAPQPADAPSPAPVPPPPPAPTRFSTDPDLGAVADLMQAVGMPAVERADTRALELIQGLRSQLAAEDTQARISETLGRLPPRAAERFGGTVEPAWTPEQSAQFRAQFDPANLTAGARVQATEAATRIITNADAHPEFRALLEPIILPVVPSQPRPAGASAGAAPIPVSGGQPPADTAQPGGGGAGAVPAVSGVAGGQDGGTGASGPGGGQTAPAGAGRPAESPVSAPDQRQLAGGAAEGGVGAAAPGAVPQGAGSGAAAPAATQRAGGGQTAAGRRAARAGDQPQADQGQQRGPADGGTQAGPGADGPELTSAERKSLTRARDRLNAARVELAQAQQEVFRGKERSGRLGRNNRLNAAREEFDNAEQAFYRTSAAVEKTAAERRQAPTARAAALAEAGTPFMQEVATSRRPRDRTLFQATVEDGAPISQAAARALETNDIGAALRDLSRTAETPTLRRIAERLAPILDGATAVRVESGLTTDTGEFAYGAASPDGTIIVLNPDRGVAQETLLHESVHAATERMLRAPAAELTQDQQDARGAIAKLWRDMQTKPRVAEAMSGPAKESLSEFIAEVMTNTQLQQRLEQQPYNLGRAFARLKRFILDLLGMTERDNALAAALTAIDTLLARPAAVYRGEPNAPDQVPEQGGVQQERQPRGQGRQAPEAGRGNRLQRAGARPQGAAQGQEVGQDKTETPEFKRWFGGSKVVDADGKPLVVYHGTRADITQFKKTKGAHLGFHFGDVEAANTRLEDTADGKIDAAEVEWFRVLADQRYAELSAFKEALRRKDGEPPMEEIAAALDRGEDFLPILDRYRYQPTEQEQAELERLDAAYRSTLLPIRKTGTGSNILPVYLAIKKPLRMPDVGNWGSAKTVRDALPWDSDARTIGQVLEEIAARGYDGIVYANRVENPVMKTDSYIAFRPEQIKSAIGNRGTFDPTNPNILYATSIGARATAALKSTLGSADRVRSEQDFLGTGQPGAAPVRETNLMAFADGITRTLIDHSVEATNLIDAEARAVPKLAAMWDRVKDAMLTWRNRSDAFFEEHKAKLVDPYYARLAALTKQSGRTAEDLHREAGAVAQARHALDRTRQMEADLNDTLDRATERVTQFDAMEAALRGSRDRVQALVGRVGTAVDRGIDGAQGGRLVAEALQTMSDMALSLERAGVAVPKVAQLLRSLDAAALNEASGRNVVDALQTVLTTLGKVEALVGDRNAADVALQRAQAAIADYNAAQNNAPLLERGPTGVMLEKLAAPLPGGIRKKVAQQKLAQASPEALELATLTRDLFTQLSDLAVANGVADPTKVANYRRLFPNYVSFMGDSTREKEDLAGVSPNRAFFEDADGAQTVGQPLPPIVNLVAKLHQLSNVVGSTELRQNLLDIAVTGDSALVKMAEGQGEKGAARLTVYGQVGRDQVVAKIALMDTRLSEGMLQTQVLTSNIGQQISRATGFYGRLVTQFVPAFAPINFMRDAMTRTFNFVGRQELTPGEVNKVRANFVQQLAAPGNWAQVWQFIRTGTPTGDMAVLRDAGALLLFTDTQVSEATVEAEVKRLNPTMVGTLRKGGAAGLRFFEKYNRLFEAAIPLATFKALRSTGMTEAKAAAVTVDMMNFRARGTLTPWLNAAFPFFAATAQDARQTVRTLMPNGKPNPRAWAELVALAGAAATLFAMARDSDDDDEFGGKAMDALTTDHERNLVIPAGDGSYIKVPIGFGLVQLAWNFGVNAVRYQTGVMSAEGAVLNMGKAFFKTLTPTGVSDIDFSKDPAAAAVMTLMPGLAKPVAQAAMNKNFAGGKITYADSSGDEFLSEQGRAATPEVYKAIAQAMRENTGADMAPEIVQTILQGYLIGPLAVLPTLADDRVEKGLAPRNFGSPEANAAAAALGANRLVRPLPANQELSNKAYARMEQALGVLRRTNVAEPKADDIGNETIDDKLTRAAAAGATDDELQLLQGYLEYRQVDNALRREQGKLRSEADLGEFEQRRLEAMREFLAKVGSH